MVFFMVFKNTPTEYKIHGSDLPTNSTIILSKKNSSTNVTDTEEQSNLMLKIENRQNLVNCQCLLYLESKF